MAKPRVIKVRLAIAQPDIDWARAQAESSGASLSAFVSESLAQRRRAAAWAELRDEKLGRPLTEAELARAEQAWKG